MFAFSSFLPGGKNEENANIDRKGAHAYGRPSVQFNFLKNA
jgi:hypothetical protein